jgi:hypothetical protein
LRRADEHVEIRCAARAAGNQHDFRALKRLQVVRYGCAC